MTKDQFCIPEGVIYHDGNSLGPLSLASERALDECIKNQWGHNLIKNWNMGWMDLSGQIATKLAPLLGAPAKNISLGDSTSVQWYKLLRGFMPLGREYNIICEADIFPTNRYIIQQLCREFAHIKCQFVDDVVGHINPQTDFVCFSMVDYKTAKLADIHAISQGAEKNNAKILCDLSHSTGCIAQYLREWRVAGAVGCGYKYLNGGPGAPAYIYIDDEFLPKFQNPIAGWFAAENPFEFGFGFEPANNINRARCGTPPVLGLTALDAALTAFDGVDMPQLKQETNALSQLFLHEMDEFFQNGQLQCLSPRNNNQRGGHLAIGSPDGYAIMQNLIAMGVIGDFRPPNLMRLAFTPLYLTNDDIMQSTAILKQILRQKTYLQPQFQAKKMVV